MAGLASSGADAAPEGRSLALGPPGGAAGRRWLGNGVPWGPAGSGFGPAPGGPLGMAGLGTVSASCPGPRHAGGSPSGRPLLVLSAPTFFGGRRQETSVGPPRAFQNVAMACASQGGRRPSVGPRSALDGLPLDRATRPLLHAGAGGKRSAPAKALRRVVPVPVPNRCTLALHSAEAPRTGIREASPDGAAEAEASSRGCDLQGDTSRRQTAMRRARTAVRSRP